VGVNLLLDSTKAPSLLLSGNWALGQF
jgi:hypothetical protein